METIWVFILGAIIGAGVGAIAVIFVMRGRKNKNEGLLGKQAQEKAEHKRKILDSFDSAQDGNAGISNDDVRKMIGVSDATAVRYLDELEKEGAIKQVGKTGRAVYYQKT